MTTLRIKSCRELPHLNGIECRRDKINGARHEYYCYTHNDAFNDRVRLENNKLLYIGDYPTFPRHLRLNADFTVQYDRLCMVDIEFIVHMKRALALNTSAKSIGQIKSLTTDSFDWSEFDDQIWRAQVEVLLEILPADLVRWVFVC